MKARTSLMTALSVACALTAAAALPQLSVFRTTAEKYAEIKPFLEYTFDDKDDFYKNTGTATGYTLTKNGATADIERAGYVEFTENTDLRFADDRNPFAEELTDFTIAVDINAKEAVYWHGAVFSWDSFDETGADAVEKYTRISTRKQGLSDAADWVRFSDTELTKQPSEKTHEQYYANGNGHGLCKYDKNKESGLLTLVMSLETGKTLTLRSYKNGALQEKLTYSVSGWNLYEGENKTFRIGSVVYANNPSALNGKFMGTMDNIRIYDRAMTEAQMDEYAIAKGFVATEEVAAPSVTADIQPFLEYTFDDAGDFYKNTGKSQDYTLVNPTTGVVQRAGYAEFADNACLTYEEDNNPFTELDDFTIAVDLNAKPSSWYASVFSWDSYSATGDGSTIDKYTRIPTKYTAGADWLRFSDTELTGKGSQWEYYANGQTLYQGEGTEQSGAVTLVMSLKARDTLTLRSYSSDGKLTGALSYDVSGWDLYQPSSAHKVFRIGALFDTRYPNIVSGKYAGTMDNIRIYDFAMSNAEMSEYAVQKKLVRSGVEIEESKNGSVTTATPTPAVGSEVVFDVRPDEYYALDTLTVNGQPLQAQDGVYKTEMIYDGLRVSATFQETLAGRLRCAVMTHGASIRYGDRTGLRFRLEIPESGYDRIVEGTPQGTSVSFGILMIPASYGDTYGGFTAQNLFGAEAKYDVREQGQPASGTGGLPSVPVVWGQPSLGAGENVYTFCASFTGISDGNLATPYTGVGVARVESDGQTVYQILNYAGGRAANNTRSVYQVAKTAIGETQLTTQAKKWIQTNCIDKIESRVQNLSGKKLSVLGDSISTYQGISNDTSVNASIGENAVFYHKQMERSDTWWQQAADETGMEILVNNSYASSNVSTGFGNQTKGGCTARAENLHSDAGVNPDIIAVYIGINDNGCMLDLGEFNAVSDIWDGQKYVGDTEKFATAYATMVHRIVTKYDGADVFLFTLPRNGYLWETAGKTKEEYNALQDAYNEMIIKIAKIFNCGVVDLASAVGENYGNFLPNDTLHPDKTGMDVITKAFETALYGYYGAGKE